jgi:hypothetical protein
MASWVIAIKLEWNTQGVWSFLYDYIFHTFGIRWQSKSYPRRRHDSPTWRQLYLTILVVKLEVRGRAGENVCSGDINTKMTWRTLFHSAKSYLRRYVDLAFFIFTHVFMISTLYRSRDIIEKFSPTNMFTNI